MPLEQTLGGKLEYRLKKPAPNGATVLVLTPLQLVKRRCGEGRPRKRQCSASSSCGGPVLVSGRS